MKQREMVKMIMDLHSKDEVIRKQANKLYVKHVLEPVWDIIDKTPANAFGKVWGDVCERLEADGIKISVTFSDSPSTHVGCGCS